MKQYTYKCIKVQIDGSFNVNVVGKQKRKFTQYDQLNIGGLYYLSGGLYRVLELVEECEI